MVLYSPKGMLVSDKKENFIDKCNGIDEVQVYYIDYNKPYPQNYMFHDFIWLKVKIQEKLIYIEITGHRHKETF